MGEMLTVLAMVALAQAYPEPMGALAWTFLAACCVASWRLRMYRN